MRKTKVDAASLSTAVGYRGDEMIHYLDTRTGNVLSAVPDSAITGNPKRYAGIAPLPSPLAWELMADFVEDLEDSRLKERLLACLGRRNPFRAFEELLVLYPETHGAWTRYRRARLCDLGRAWLRARRIDAELVGGKRLW